MIEKTINKCSHLNIRALLVRVKERWSELKLILEAIYLIEKFKLLLNRNQELPHTHKLLINLQSLPTISFILIPNNFNNNNIICSLTHYLRLNQLALVISPIQWASIINLNNHYIKERFHQLEDLQMFHQLLWKMLFRIRISSVINHRLQVIHNFTEINQPYKILWIILLNTQCLIKLLSLVNNLVVHSLQRHSHNTILNNINNTNSHHHMLEMEWVRIRV